MLTSIKNVYIIGLGAMGALYASKLHDHDLTLVKVILDATRKQRYEQQGFDVNHQQYQFNYITPEQTATAAKADLIIIAVKSTQLTHAIELCKPVLKAETRIISLLNGISSEKIIAEHLGESHPFYAYGIAMDARRQNTSVQYTKAGFLVFGEKDNTQISHDVAQVQQLFDQAHIPYQTPQNMIYALWKKFMLNVAANQVTAILKFPYREVKHNPHVQQLLFNAAHEVLAISQAMNTGLTEQDVSEILTPMLQLDDHAYTSMCQDILANRPTEVGILGEMVIELGQQYQIATPINQVLVQLIHAMEDSFQR